MLPPGGRNWQLISPHYQQYRVSGEWLEIMQDDWLHCKASFTIRF